MKSLLAKIALRKVIGLSLGEHHVAVSVVASTPLGPVQIASSTEEFTPETLGDVIEKQLKPFLSRRRRPIVAVGLPSSRLFSGTRPVATGASTPEAILQKSLYSSNIVVDDMAVDLLRTEVNKASVTSVVACRKKYMANIIAILNRMNIRPLRTEPVPWAFVRASIQQHGAMRRSKMVLQVFLGENQGLAVVVANGIPITWRTFPITAGMEGFGILSASRTLLTQNRHYGIESALDYAVINGRQDIHERLQQEQFPSDIGTRVIWHPGPAFDGEAAAYGLALGCLTPDATAFDLSRALKSRPSLWEIFPWWDFAFVSILVLAMGLVLGAHSMQLNEAYTMLHAQFTQHKSLTEGGAKDLEKLKKELTTKLDAVRGFLDSRVQWSAYNRDISLRLPAEVTIDSLEGKAALSLTGRNDAARALLLRAKVPLAADGSTPREIDSLINELRNDPVLGADFGSIQLANIRRVQAKGSDRSLANFTITCLPAGKGEAKAKKGGK